MEVMLVVIILGILAAFAIPNYTKSLEKAHIKDAVVQLTVLHAANSVYRTQSGFYLAGNLGNSLANINSNLGINIIASDMTYVYSAADLNPTTFSAYAEYVSGGTTFRVTVTESAIQKGTNPKCSIQSGPGTCPAGY